MTSSASWTFCEQILPDVSRSFALIIPLCPAPIDRALCVAYLICRLADTVEDEPALTPAQRAALYDALLAAVEAPLDQAQSRAFVSHWPRVPEGDYGRLILGTHHVLAAFASLPGELLPPIRACVRDMIAGMRRVQPHQSRGDIEFVCRDLADLDQYCHYVAGTVGIMSTALFETRFAPLTDAATWREQGRRLGLGLQMTNILKDCRIDARRGASFIPLSFVEFSNGAYRLGAEGRDILIGHTVAHLDAALLYILAVPPQETGIRAFLLGSMFPAIATLEVVAASEEPQPKITRATMAEIMRLISEQAQDDGALRAWYERHRASALSLAKGASPDSRLAG